MEIVKKLSQKQLCEEAKRIGAIRLAVGNCYYYEACLANNNNLIDRLAINVARDSWGNYIISKWKMYYCEGITGNTGQMHEIRYINNYGVECSCYVYYTCINYNKD